MQAQQSDARKQKPIFPIQRVIRLACRTVQQACRMGGMNSDSGRERMRKDARLGQTAERSGDL